MKVSRKLGRRKHSRSSFVSRRRLRNKKNKKSGYKKRYAKTQKGGKYGKRGRGQKRMGACTHKRGKRFHRGGMFDECYIELGKLLNKQLKYKKEGALSTAETKPFDATIYGWKFRTDTERKNKIDEKSGNEIDVGCFYGKDAAKIVFIRKTEKSVTITMEFTLGRGDVSKSDILSSGTAKEGNKVVKYSFDYPENESFYKDALALINSNRIKNTDLTAKEKMTKEDAEREKEGAEREEMNKARKKSFDIQKQFNEMKKSDYNGNYSELSVDLFPYMTSSEQEIEKKAKGSDKPVVMVNFKDFKEKQEKLALDTKKAIESSSLDNQEKNSRKQKVDTLLKEIIDTQKELMLAVYLIIEGFKGEYGDKVYTEQTQGALQNQFNEPRGIVSNDSFTMYSEVQKDIQKMKNLAENLTPANVVTAEDSATTNLASSEGYETLPLADSNVAAQRNNVDAPLDAEVSDEQ